MSKFQRGGAALVEATKNKGFSKSRETYSLRMANKESVKVRFLGMFKRPLTHEAIDALSKEELTDLYAGYSARTPKDFEGKFTYSVMRECLKSRMDEAEPVLFSQHNVKQGQRFDTIFCTESTPGDWDGIPCLACEEQKKQGKGGSVSYALTKGGYSVLVMDKQHRVQENKDSKAEYLPCTMDATGKCSLCKKTNENGPVYPSRVKGVRKWVVGKAQAEEIAIQISMAEKACLSCHSGEIRVKGYSCEGCGAAIKVSDPSFTHRCKECGHKALPKENIMCTECDEPVRSSLSDYVCSITRTGEGAQTRYTIIAERLRPMDEDELKFAPVNWDDELKPLSTQEQATILGLKLDPHTNKGVGSTSYDEEDDDEEE